MHYQLSRNRRFRTGFNYRRRGNGKIIGDSRNGSEISGCLFLSWKININPTRHTCPLLATHFPPPRRCKFDPSFSRPRTITPKILLISGEDFWDRNGCRHFSPRMISQSFDFYSADSWSNHFPHFLPLLKSNRRGKSSPSGSSYRWGFILRGQGDVPSSAKLRLTHLNALSRDVRDR